MFGKKQKLSTDINDAAPSNELRLHQWMPQEFTQALDTWLEPAEEPSATLFVPSDRILEWIPGRALALINYGALFLEEGESVILNQKWGVKAMFYPYRQISAVGIGHALLRGRFTLYSAGGVPPCEIILPWHNLNNFKAAARMIRLKAAKAASGQPNENVDYIRYSRKLDGAAEHQRYHRYHRMYR
jgi:hypothetical protein